MKSSNLCSIGFLFARTYLVMTTLKFLISLVSAFKLFVPSVLVFCVCESSEPGKYPICKDCQNDGKVPVLKRKRSLATV